MRFAPRGSAAGTGVVRGSPRKPEGLLTPAFVANVWSNIWEVRDGCGVAITGAHRDTMVTGCTTARGTTLSRGTLET